MEINDLYRTPDDGFRYELVRGHLVPEPPTGMRHGHVSARFVSALDSFTRRNGGVVLTGEPGFILQRSPDTVRAPDVAWITRARYLAVEDESRYFPGAPDLAVEVLSPGNTRLAIADKVADYLSAGTVVVWVADPQTQTVTAHRPLLAPKTLSGFDLLTAADLMPGFGVLVSDLFSL